VNPPAVAQSPSLHLTILDLDPLARALVAECGGWQEAAEPLPPYARTMFAALAAVVWRLAEQPSPVVMPAGRSAEVRTALRLTEERLADEVRFEDLAADDTPVTTIAHEVGYGSLSAFNAAFRELTVATPSDYRATFTR
jgi:transcriptional regulator GlxA family with amidase domain